LFSLKPTDVTRQQIQTFAPGRLCAAFKQKVQPQAYSQRGLAIGDGVSQGFEPPAFSQAGHAVTESADAGKHHAVGGVQSGRGRFKAGVYAKGSERFLDAQQIAQAVINDGYAHERRF
jgi:hypothetical protein